MKFWGWWRQPSGEPTSVTLGDLDGFSSWKTGRPWFDAEPVNLEEGESFEMTVAWDADHVFRTLSPKDDHDPDETREMVFTFNRWKFPKFLFRRFGRWLPRRFFKTYTCNVKLVGYRVLAEPGELQKAEATFMPVGVGRWS